MKFEIKYIELKSGNSGNGPAWIGHVSFSKSGKTVYFDGKAFKRIGSDRLSGNYYDIESGDEYWISGVKKDMSDERREKIVKNISLIVSLTVLFLVIFPFFIKYF